MESNTITDTLVSLSVETALLYRANSHLTLKKTDLLTVQLTVMAKEGVERNPPDVTDWNV